MSPRSRLSFTRATRLAASALAAALVMAGLVVAVPTAAQAASTSHALSAPTSVHLGSTATLKASWVTRGKKVTGSLKLQKRTGSTWHTVAKVKLVKGKGSVKITPTASASYRLRSATYTSKTRRLTVVKNWLVLHSTPGAIRAGSTASLTLKVYKDAKPVSVVAALQRLSGKTWVTVKRLTVSKKGTKVAVHPTSTTVYRLARSSLRSSRLTVTVDRDWAALAISSRALPTSASSTRASVTWYAAGKKADGTIVLQQRTGSGPWTTAAKIKVANGKGAVTIKPLVTRTYRLLAGKVSSSAVKVTVKKVIPTSFTVHGSGLGHGVGMSQYGAYGMALDGYSAKQILQHYYSGDSVGLDGRSASSRIRVQLSSTATSLPIKVVGGAWRAGTLSATSGATVTFATTDGVSVTAKANGKKITAKNFTLKWSGSQTYATWDATPNTYHYGTLRISVIGKKLNIVNDVTVTQYLYGLGEVPSSWPSAAMQAQIIAARSMALTSHRKNCECDIYGDPRDQHYVGWTKVTGTGGAKWVAAVDATVDSSGQGKVVKNPAGEIERAYYDSSTGGSTLNSEDVWAAKVPAMRSVDDHWSHDPRVHNTLASWTATLTQAKAAKLFGLKDVVSIAVGHVKGGGIYSLTGKASNGQVVKLGGKANDPASKTERMRSQLNAYTTGTIYAPWVKSITPNLP